MISLDEALQAYVDRLQPLPAETMPLNDALHRVLAEDLQSRTDLPRFDQSAMDGYALRSADTDTASTEQPLTLPVSGTSAAGRWPHEALQPGTAWRIYTGAPVPEGADTVIPQERVQREGDKLIFDTPYPPGKNIRYRGEELAEQTPVASAGQRLHPGLIASLCNAGIHEVRVTRAPRIAVIITGDEVRPPGAKLAPADIPDSNGSYIRSWLQANGYPAASLRYASDEKATVKDLLASAAETADLIITTGGASVGDRDFVPAVARELGFGEVFWKVAQKPGKPLFFGLRENQPLLALPGNPGAVLVGMELHVRTVLNLLQGLQNPLPQWRNATLADIVNADTKRDRLLRMQLNQDSENRQRISPLEKQDSHMLSNLSQAKVIAWLPCREMDYEAGESVRYVALTQ